MSKETIKYKNRVNTVLGILLAKKRIAIDNTAIDK